VSECSPKLRRRRRRRILPERWRQQAGLLAPVFTAEAKRRAEGSDRLLLELDSDTSPGRYSLGKTAVDFYVTFVSVLFRIQDTNRQSCMDPPPEL